MKKIILCSIILTCFFFSNAQTKKIELFCEVSENEVKYGKLEKFLPDSLRSKLIKIKHRPDPIDVLNIFSMHGWTLVSATAAPPTSVGFRYNYYLLKIEFPVSSEEYNAILKRMDKYFVD
jgi:hypothetical protein